MASDYRSPTERVNFFDGQIVSEKDLDVEQVYNSKISSNIVSDFHKSGVLKSNPFDENILLDTRTPSSSNPSKSVIESGNFDGRGIFFDKAVSDNVRGVRLELELVDSYAKGRDKVKVILLGRTFDGVDEEGPLTIEYIEFSKNEKKVSQNFYRELEAVFFNNFSGGTGKTFYSSSVDSLDLISESNGYMIIKESEPLSVYSQPVMISQVESPNIDLANFITSSVSKSIMDEFESALGASSSASELYVDMDGVEKLKFSSSGDLTTSYGQKFLSRSNNLQGVEVLLSVEENETYGFDWSGDLVLSIYNLSTDVSCISDSVPEELIDFNPENTPLSEISLSQDDLEALGYSLSSTPQKVMFSFSGTLLSDPNIDPSISANKYYAFTLSRRGDNQRGTILLEKGNTVKYGKSDSSIPLTVFEEYSKDTSRYFTYDPSTNRYVSDSNSSLWYKVYSDSIEITDGLAYTEEGKAVSIPKTQNYIGSSEISFFNSIDLKTIKEGEDNYVILSHVNKFTTPGSHPVTNNHVFKRIEDSASIDVVTSEELPSLSDGSAPLILAKVTDKNVRSSEAISGVFDKPGFIYRDYVIIEEPSDSLLSENLIGRIFYPDTDCECNKFYRITKVECLNHLAGDLDSDGELTTADIAELLSVVGNTINSESTEKDILSGSLDIIDFIKADLDNNETVDGIDIELLEDAIDGYVNFAIPEQVRFLKLSLENIFESEDYPEIFKDTALSGISSSSNNIINFTTSNYKEAFAIREYDFITIESGDDSGTYKILTKTIDSDNISVSVTVSDLSGNSISFSGATGFNVTVSSGKKTNLFADNLNLLTTPYSNLSYEIIFPGSTFSSEHVEVCDLRRFVESSFLELSSSSCNCTTESLCPDTENCSPKYKIQKYLPGDLYVPNGEIYSEPGIPHHGDYEYVTIKMPLPPGSIDDCYIDLYNTFIKSEDGSCKTAAGYPALKYSDGTYVGCDDSGSTTDLTRGRVKISHSISGLFVDGVWDGYGIDGYGESTDSSSSYEHISESFVGDIFSEFSSWVDDPGNNTSITNISNPSGVNNPAVFDLTTTSDSGERYGRLNIPSVSADFEDDFIVDFSASRTVWPSSSLTSGTVSAFATLNIENSDGSTSELKLGWKIVAGNSTKLFYSGVKESSTSVVLSTFNYEVEAPDSVGETIRFRIRRIDDVVSAYYLSPNYVDDGDLTSFGHYIRIGENPSVQPGSGTVTNFSYEINQNDAPTSGLSFYTRLSSSEIKSEYISEDDLETLSVGRDNSTDVFEQFLLTFPINLTGKTVVYSAYLKLTSKSNTTINDEVNVVALELLNANNVGKLSNIPKSTEADAMKSFIPGTISEDEIISVEVTDIVKKFISSSGHLPGQYKGFIIYADEGDDYTLSVSSEASLEITYLDVSTGIVFKVGISVDPLTGIATLNTKNILYDSLTEENRTVINFNVSLKKAGFINENIEVNMSDLSRLGVGTCIDTETITDNSDCFFVVGDTAVGTFVEGPFPCQFFNPYPPPSTAIES